MRSRRFCELSCLSEGGCFVWWRFRSTRAQRHHDHLLALIMEPERSEIFDEADGVEAIAERLDEEMPADEDSDVRAGAFGVSDGNSCPGLVVLVFAQQKKLPLLPFETDGFIAVRIMAGDSLDELGEGFELGGIEGDVRFRILWIGDGHTPVRVFAFDLTTDEPPAP